MGASSTSRVKRGETKYHAIGIFAASIGKSRVGVYKALEANDPVMWHKYAAFCERMAAVQSDAVADAKARVSNAKPVRFSRLAEAENLEYARRQVARVYGQEFETFTK